MILLIGGSSHTGKTLLAQKLLERDHFPYLSLDHLKMGLIRSGHCSLTAQSTDQELTGYLWPIAVEIIRTAVENKQNLIVEGCYIPFDYRRYFRHEEAKEIRYLCLIFSQKYIEAHYDDILQYANVIEHRLCEESSKEGLIEENAYHLAMCKAHGLEYLLFEEEYQLQWDWRGPGAVRSYGRY